MSAELELKTRIAILEKDLETAEQRLSIEKIKLDVTSNVMLKVIKSIVYEVSSR